MCAILSNNGLLLILIDPYYLCNIDNKTQFKFDTLLRFYWSIAGARVTRRALIGRENWAIGGERECEAEHTATCSNFIPTIKYNVIDWNYFLFLR